MESIDPKCTELKHKYEACFNQWYSERYLQGEMHDECGVLFKEYRACLQLALDKRNITKMLQSADDS